MQCGILDYHEDTRAAICKYANMNVSHRWINSVKLILVLVNVP